jgi:hypothetical protein
VNVEYCNKELPEITTHIPNSKPFFAQIKQWAARLIVASSLIAQMVNNDLY